MKRDTKPFLNEMRFLVLLRDLCWGVVILILTSTELVCFRDKWISVSCGTGRGP